MADVVNGTPLRFQACDALELRAGEHRLNAPPTAEFQVVEVVGQVLAGTHTGTSGGRRPVRCGSVRWTSSERTTEIGAGGESLLHLPENFNDGWVAEIDGTRLQALRVDGWQQAWVLPASDEVVRIEISYRPQRVYDVVLPIGLAVSGLVLLAGLALLLVGLGRRRPRTTDAVWGLVSAPRRSALAGARGGTDPRRLGTDLPGRCARGHGCGIATRRPAGVGCRRAAAPVRGRRWCSGSGLDPLRR